MTPTSLDIDYKNNFFEHTKLTRIVGEPSTTTLNTLQAEIRDNAKSGQSDLGGGEHGHCKFYQKISQKRISFGARIIIKYLFYFFY